MAFPLVLDLETQFSFRQVGYDHRKLKVSLVGVYNYATRKYLTYFEKDLPKFFPLLEQASVLIGFNIKKFDLPVLSPYYWGNINQFPVLDILEEVEKTLGFRVALDDLARATLGKKKTGHGFLALNYFQKKEWEKLKNYCLEDVKITKEIYEFGRKNGKLYFLGKSGKREIPVSFQEKKGGASVALSLPF